jgi:hypothetical protein
MTVVGPWTIWTVCGVGVGVGREKSGLVAIFSCTG